MVGVPGLSPSLGTPLAQVALAGALGLFLGLEREWSQKPAGIRTFALVAVLGPVLHLYDKRAEPSVSLVAVGGVFVVVLAGVLMYGGARQEEGLRLTTPVSLVVAYGVGLLVVVGEALPAVVVTVASSVLLVFKRELHSFAWGLSRPELRSTVEFAILAFVVYPLLPAGPVAFGSVAVEPRVVWLMVVFVAGVGIVNYAVVSSYGSRGVAVSGFFGGLVSSAAVVGSMRDYVDRGSGETGHAVAAVFFANAAMALRNLVLVAAFTLPDRSLLVATVPLFVLAAAAVGIAALVADWDGDVSVEVDTPFSVRNALGFGTIFLTVVVAGGLARSVLGTGGFYAATALTGLVSSAGAVTSTVALYRTGTVAGSEAVAVKAGLVAGADRRFVRRVLAWTVVLLAVGAVATVVAVQYW